MRIDNFGPARDATFLVKVSDKVKTIGGSLRLLYRHGKRSPSTSEDLKTSGDRFGENGDRNSANSFQEILSFINIMIDHIVLLSIAEVQRRQIQQQKVLVETLKNHILSNETVDTADDGSIVVKGNESMERSGARRRGNSNIIIRKNGNISIDSLDGTTSTTIGIGKNLSSFDTRTNNDNNGCTSDNNQDDDDGGMGDGKKFELLLLVKVIRRCLLSYLETYEFTRLSICSSSLQKTIPEEKRLWKNSVRVCPPSNKLRGKFWMHCGGIPSFLNRKTEKGFYFKLPSSFV